MQPNTGFLYQRSLQIILENQADSGAYVACPSFPVYRFCWFRDSSYIAYAVDLAGHPESAARFHDWAARAINCRTAIVSGALEKAARGEPLRQEDVLHTRYTLEGEDDDGAPAPTGDGVVAWENFQLDGFGAWLWALEQHVRLSGCQPQPEWLAAAQQVAVYLQALWRLPCYDCWEEFPDRVHTHTLAAIYGGLKAYYSLVSLPEPPVLEEIRKFILERGLHAGVFTKSVGYPVVDASLLGLSTPFRVVEPGSPYMLDTVAQIEKDLLRGGLHRYGADTYYGGGEWVLLAAWLGWYYTEVGKQDAAAQLMNWIEAQADPQGELPEQVPATLIDPTFYQPWVQRWGPVSKPLLWSHAMYIILLHALPDR